MTTYSFSGEAYGTKITAGSAIKSGPTALAELGCSTVAPRSSSNNTLVTNLKVGNTTLGATGTTVDTVTAAIVNGRHVTTADSDVQSVNILNGTITADVLHATAKAYSNPLAGSGTSTFVNLRVLGVPIGGTPAANTKISLGALGYVVLNEQTVKVTTKNATSTVNAMRVHLISVQGLVTPIDIIIGHASATIEGPTAGVMRGYAYGTNLVVLSGLIKSGKTALVNLPCRGTNGVVKTNSIATLTLPSLLTSGTVASFAVGKITETQSTATTSNTIQGVNLLGGVITATVIKTELSGVRPGGGTETLTDNSEFLGLTINGTPYGGTPAPNTQIVLPGIGTLWLHRVVHLGNGITEVRSIELILSAAQGGLPIGTNIKVGVAGLTIHQ